MASGETDFLAMAVDSTGAGEILMQYYGEPDICQRVASWSAANELDRSHELPWCRQGPLPVPGSPFGTYGARAIAAGLDRFTHSILVGGGYRDGADLGAGPVLSRGGLDGFVEAIAR